MESKRLFLLIVGLLSVNSKCNLLESDRVIQGSQLGAEIDTRLT